MVEHDPHDLNVERRQFALGGDAKGAAYSGDELSDSGVIAGTLPPGDFAQLVQGGESLGDGAEGQRPLAFRVVWVC